MNKELIAVAAIVVLIGAGIWYLATPQRSTTTMQDNQPQVTELKVETLQEGTGEAAKTGDTVLMNYTGSLDDGTVFDSNIDPKFGHVEPFPFTLGQNRVIQGWEKGVLGMKVGEKRQLTIPSSLGYGEAGAGGLIPPNATLHFTVELLKIN